MMYHHSIKYYTVWIKITQLTLIDFACEVSVLQIRKAVREPEPKIRTIYSLRETIRIRDSSTI